MNNIQATKFYLPFFKTGVPNGRLHTYITETDIETPTYKNVSGELHSNPIILNEKGECVLYIDKDVTYRYVLKDEFGNTIKDISGIKQLNGSPGDPSIIVGSPGKKGAPGNQGLGIQGDDGIPGLDGDPGLPYLSQYEFTTSRSVTIPKGVKEIFITACAGGGAGASWSKYSFVTKTNNQNNTVFSYIPLIKRGENEDIVQSLNSVVYNVFDYTCLILTPGSGFAGQSTFKRRIALDSERENEVYISVGIGGNQNSNTTLNGSDGTNTEVYINGVKSFTLLGGKGGKNIFPVQETSLDIFPKSGQPIEYNFGYNSNLIYVKSDTTNSANYQQAPNVLNSDYVWTTTYKSYALSQPIKIKVGYNIYQQISYMYDATYNRTTVSQCFNLKGQTNIFGDNIYLYQPMTSGVSFYHSLVNYFCKTTIKTGQNKRGYGVGGDCYFDFTSNRTNISTNNATYYLDVLLKDMNNEIIMIDINYQKNMFRNYLMNLIMSDSEEPGAKKIPTLTDDSGVWNAIDTYNETIKYDPYYNNKALDEGSGFYDSFISPYCQNIPTAKGGSGTDGYALVEFGDIEEVTKT